MTKKLSVEEQLDAAIRAAAEDAAAGVPSREAAEDLCASDPDLIEHFTREWVVEKVAALIRKHRLAARPPDEAQLVLGFKMPRRVVLKSGKALAYAKATLWDLREYRRRLWKTRPTSLKSVDTAIAMMERYAKAEPGITFAAALALEAAKTNKAKT